MSDKLEIIRDGDCLRVSGTLGFSTVGQAESRWLEQLDEHSETIEIDLADVGRIDSAGLALMVGWMQVAQEKGITIRYTHLPRSLAGMAGVYGIDSLFQIVEDV